jgi:glycine cleavage system H lipoate-binding protein
VSIAPDYVEPVIGYRAWHLDDDGLLRAWTFTSHRWEAGANRAACGRDRRHRPPVGDCTCGLYALSDPADRRLHLRDEQAVGAIAAWGDLEVHRTGFRAEWACVVALARPERVDAPQLRRLELAAARYGVELVPARVLSEHAREHGAPLDPVTLPPAWPAPRHRSAGPAPLPAVEASRFAGVARGIALDAHLWVETALGAVVVGATRALAKRIGSVESLAPPVPGTLLEAGDRAATVVGASDSFAIWAPVGGRVVQINPRIVADPELLTRDPEGAGWLLRMAPTNWEREAVDVTWGRGAGRHYDACIARDVARGEGFGDVLLSHQRALPPVRGAGEVLAALRARRAAPRFADAGELAAQLGRRVTAALAADSVLRSRLANLGMTIAFALHEPGATLLLDLRTGELSMSGADAGDDADLVLHCSAESAYQWFTGALDPAAAVRRGDLRSSAGSGATLRALAVLKHLRIPAW